MKKYKNILSSFLLIIFCLIQFTSCSTVEKIVTPNQINVISPGKISLTYMDGLEKKSEYNENDSTEFYMGNLKASRDFYFIIRNTGGSIIKDISIESSNPMFPIIPSEIQLLVPDSDVSIFPILRISATHGVALDGIGYTELMPMDTNLSIINITGTTLAEDSTDTTISLTAKISVNSLVMDIDLFGGSKLINLTEGFGGASTNLGGLGFLRVYECDSIPKIKNIGNVSIYLTYPMDSWITPIRDTLNIGNILTFDLIDSIGIIVIQLDGQNTICDNNRLQIGNDGKVYFAISKTSS